jgi:hypothetical protein
MYGATPGLVYVNLKKMSVPKDDIQIRNFENYCCESFPSWLIEEPRRPLRYPGKWEHICTNMAQFVSSLSHPADERSELASHLPE